VRTFLDVLEEIDASQEFSLYFRGHANFSYELKPYIYRDDNWVQNEDILFKEMVLKCPDEFKDQENTFQMLVKMQHYSLPTRLLDITANPLIALYFACSEGKSKLEGGEVVVFKIPKRDIRYHDSDTVSVLANISRRPADFGVPRISDEEKFNNSKQMRYLLHEIKQEKPYFEAKIKRAHLESVICVKPKLDNPRIIKQDGAFLLFGVKGKKNTPAIIDKSHLYSEKRIIVKHLEKSRILDQLHALGITKGSIYPEIDRVAEHLRDIYASSDKELTSSSSGRRKRRR
jgi:hypothetical protein